MHKTHIFDKKIMQKKFTYLPYFFSDRYRKQTISFSRPKRCWYTFPPQYLNHHVCISELDDLYEQKRHITAEFRKQEREYFEQRDDSRRKQREDQARKREEERRAHLEAKQRARSVNPRNTSHSRLTFLFPVTPKKDLNEKFWKLEF